MKFAKYANKKQIYGYEFLSGIPGTIGGSIKMNAGCYEREFKDIITSFFNSIDLTPIQIDLFGQSVVYMKNESYSVYNILDSDGAMKVGLVIY